MFPSRRTTLGGDVFRDEYSLEFDGTDYYVYCGNPSDLQITGTAITASAWININSFVEWSLIFGNASGGSWTNGWALLWSGGASGKLKFSINHFNNFASYDYPDTLTNQWEHVVGTYDGAYIKIYVNGVLWSKVDSEFTDSIGNTENTVIGIHESGTDVFFNGKISETALYNTALTASQIKTLYNGREPYNHKEGIAAGNLVSWCRMGDGTERGVGTTIYDMSANTNDGTMTNMDAATDYTGDTPA